MRKLLRNLNTIFHFIVAHKECFFTVLDDFIMVLENFWKIFKTRKVAACFGPDMNKLNFGKDSLIFDRHADKLKLL